MDGQRHLELLDLESGCQLIAETHPELAAIFLEAGKSFIGKENVFGKAQYRFGDMIINRGQVKAPCGCLHCETAMQIFPSDIPLGLVCQKKIEVTNPLSDLKQIPLRLLKPGEIFGVFETLDRFHNLAPSAQWNIYAGGHSIAVDASPKNKPLCKHVEHVYGGDYVTYTTDEEKYLGVKWWDLVRLIARRQNDVWHATVVFVSSSLMEKAKEKLLPSLYKTAWFQLQDRRNEYDDRKYRQLSDGDLVKNLNYLLGVAQGQKLAYRPVTNDDTSGPFMEFLKDFLKSGFKTCPLLFEPAYFDPDGEDYPVYFSLNSGHIKLSGKYSTSLDSIAKQMKHLKNEAWTNHVTLFASDSSNFGGEKFSIYRDTHFPKDFAEQLEHNKIAKPKNDGFLTAFARISGR